MIFIRFNIFIFIEDSLLESICYRNYIHIKNHIEAVSSITQILNKKFKTYTKKRKYIYNLIIIYLLFCILIN